MRKLLTILLCLAVLNAETILSLPECIGTALSNNEVIKIQELKVEELKAKVWVKTASMLPYIGGSASYDHTRLNTDSYFMSLALTQPLFAGGQYWHDRALAKLELEQAELELEKARQELSLDTAAAYYRLWHAQEILSANMQSKDNLREYYKKSKQLAEQTRLPRQEELLQVAVQLGNAEIAVNNAVLNWSKACVALENFMVEIPADARQVIAQGDIADFFRFTSAPTLAAEIKIFPAEDMLSRSFEYQLALLTERQREASAKISAGAYWPQINLQAYSGVEWGETFPKDETTYSQWGVSLQMLLFDFFKTPKQVEQSSRVREQAALNSERVGRSVLIKDADIYSALRAAVNKMKLTARNVSRAEKSLKLYQERGQSYTANSKQLLDAEQAALQAKTSQLDSLLDYNLNVLESKRLQGESL